MSLRHLISGGGRTEAEGPGPGPGPGAGFFGVVQLVCYDPCHKVGLTRIVEDTGTFFQHHVRFWIQCNS